MNKSRAVIVTGCYGGIGRALSKAFREAGYLVIGTDRKQGAATCDHFIAVDLEQLTADAARQGEVQARVRDILRQSSAHLGVLINNAAVQRTGTFDVVGLDAFEESHRVNLVAPLVLARLFANDLRYAKGTIVNIGSVHGRLTKSGFCAYSVSKAGLAALTRALALDFAGEVTVNTICPAAIDTPMLKAGFGNATEKLEQLGGHHPVGRIGRSEEVAGVAVFLASELARFITGAEVCVDGGISVRLHDPV